MYRTILLGILLFLQMDLLLADSTDKSCRILVDTDAGIDDLRAICLLLAKDEIEVVGFTTSDGMCDPITGYQKVHSLLRFLGHEGIPVFPGERKTGKMSPYSDLCYSLDWGKCDTNSCPPLMQADQYLISHLSSETADVTLLALGPLTNYARMLEKQPALAGQIKRIIWYIDDVNPIKGDNYSFDPESYGQIASHKIPLIAVSASTDMELSFDSLLYSGLEQKSSRYAIAVHQAFSVPIMNQRLNARHFGLWDDLVSLFLMYPESFQLEQIDDASQLMQYTPMSGHGLCQQWLGVILDESNDSKVFSFFPTDTCLFADDIRPVMDQIIRRHGLKEWRAGVITNELHGHLGVYAIIGTKMGMRAREFFRAGHDQLEVFSHAGTAPPVSCLNDGLQVSTGATTGHGLIRTATEGPFEPCAMFSHQGHSITIRLKESYWQTVRENITGCIQIKGNLSDGYWECIRELALRCWVEWDRFELFEIIVEQEMP